MMDISKKVTSTKDLVATIQSYTSRNIRHSLVDEIEEHGVTQQVYDFLLAVLNRAHLRPKAGIPEDWPQLTTQEERSYNDRVSFLSEKDYRDIEELLGNPPAPSQGLVDVMDEYRRAIESGQLITDLEAPKGVVSRLENGEVCESACEGSSPSASADSVLPYGMDLKDIEKISEYLSPIALDLYAMYKYTDYTYLLQKALQQAVNISEWEGIVTIGIVQDTPVGRILIPYMIKGNNQKWMISVLK